MFVMLLDKHIVVNMNNRVLIKHHMFCKKLHVCLVR
jgi:hypothetical protein